MLATTLAARPCWRRTTATGSSSAGMAARLAVRRPASPQAEGATRPHARRTAERIAAELRREEQQRHVEVDEGAACVVRVRTTHVD